MRSLAETSVHEIDDAELEMVCDKWEREERAREFDWALDFMDEVRWRDEQEALGIEFAQMDTKIDH